MSRGPIDRVRRQSTSLPSRKQILDFIAASTGPAGKREIAKAFGLKGHEKIQLKALLKDMAEEGLIDGQRTAYHRMGGVPRVTVLRIVAIDDGEAIAVPDNWDSDDAAPPPRLAVREKGRRSALGLGDRVLARTEETPTGWAAHPIKKLLRNADQMMGVVEFDANGKPWLAPVDKRVRHAVAIADLAGAASGQLVMAEPAGRSARAGVKVCQVLGDPLAPKAFSLIAISKHGIPFIMPAEAQAEAELAAGLPIHMDQREDLRDLPIVAIDPSDARDHDDAIWAASDGAGGFRVLIAIADVSYYVRPGGAIDREARRRGNSVYFPDRVVPMLPEVLSADMCSLRAGQDRAAMVCHLTVNATGQVTSWRFSRAVVRIHEVIAYEEAQRRIDAGDAEQHLQQLWAAWAVLASARHARHPLELDLPERRVVLDDTGKICSIAVRQRLDAHRLVEDFMIAANVAAAKALEQRMAPTVYRLHEAPSREKLIALKDYLATLGRKFALGQVIRPETFNHLLAAVSDEADRALLMEAVLRCQTQAYYGPRNCGHFGLALGSYVHFTSPIRRYADLLIHRALVDAEGLEQPRPVADLPAGSGLAARDRHDLSRICDAISAAERRAMEAERDTVDRYVAAWLSSRVGEVFETRITGVQKFGLFATIVGLGGDGLVPVSLLGDERFEFDSKGQVLRGAASGTVYAAGGHLRLRLAEANPLTGALKFEPPDTQSAIEPRGQRPAGRQRGKYLAGKRGRPANIRHQGKGR